MQLLLPPATYSVLESPANANPNHPTGISKECKRLFFLVSMSCRECLPWPLLVTASNFLLGAMAIFMGKSPNSKELPAGVSDQPVGNKMEFPVACLPIFWAKIGLKQSTKKDKKTKVRILINLSCWYVLMIRS